MAQEAQVVLRLTKVDGMQTQLPTRHSTACGEFQGPTTSQGRIMLLTKLTQPTQLQLYVSIIHHGKPQPHPNQCLTISRQILSINCLNPGAFQLLCPCWLTFHLLFEPILQKTLCTVRSLEMAVLLLSVCPLPNQCLLHPYLKYMTDLPVYLPQVMIAYQRDGEGRVPLVVSR